MIDVVAPHWHQCKAAETEPYCTSGDEFVVEGESYRIVLPQCSLYMWDSTWRAVGRVQMQIAQLAEHLHRTIIHRDQVKDCLDGRGPIGEVDAHSYVMERVRPVYRSSYTSYYLLRDVARAAHDLPKRRCWHCGKVRRFINADCWYLRWCSYECCEAWQRAQQEEQQWLKQGRRTLRTIRKYLRDLQQHPEVSLSQNEGSRPVTILPTS